MHPPKKHRIHVINFIKKTKNEKQNHSIYAAIGGGDLVQLGQRQ